MTDRDAMKLALEALEFAASQIYNEDDDDIIAEAIEALRQALEQPEQEPVAFVCRGKFSTIEHCEECEPLYTAPPKREWVGLTDEDRYKAIRPLYDSDENARLAVEHSNDEYEAIEAKLKEKNI